MGLHTLSTKFFVCLCVSFCVLWKMHAFVARFEQSLEYSQHLLNEYNNMSTQQRTVNMKTHKGVDGSGVPGLSVFDIAFQVARTLHLIGSEKKNETVQAYQRCYVLRQKILRCTTRQGKKNPGNGQRPDTTESAPTAFGRTLLTSNSITGNLDGDDNDGMMSSPTHQLTFENERPSTTLGGSRAVGRGGREGRGRGGNPVHEQAHDLIEWLHDPRTWHERAMAMAKHHYWLPTIDLCRQCLKRLKTWENGGHEEKLNISKSVEWLMAQALYAINDLNGACEYGSHVVLLGTKSLALVNTVQQWNVEKSMQPKNEGNEKASMSKPYKPSRKKSPQKPLRKKKKTQPKPVNDNQPKQNTMSSSRAALLIQSRQRRNSATVRVQQKRNSKRKNQKNRKDPKQKKKQRPKSPLRPKTPVKPREPFDSDAASRHIQSMYRKRDARRHVNNKRKAKLLKEKRKQEEIEKKIAILKVQSLARRKAANQRVGQLRAVKLESDQQHAATLMQGMYRSKTARSKVAKIKAKNAYKDLMKKRKNKLLIHIESQNHLTATNGSPNSALTTPMFGVVRSPASFQRTFPSSPAFASPKKQLMLDKWHDKLKRVLVVKNNSPTKNMKTSIQMQTLVSSVATIANVYPEEACCALVDSKYRKHMGRWVTSTSTLLTKEQIDGVVADVSAKLKDPAYFNEIRTVCDVLDVKKYAKNGNSGSNGQRHLHPWCADQQKLQYEITVDQVLEAGNIEESDYIQWSSDGNEHLAIEEQDLLGELKQEGLSNRKSKCGGFAVDCNHCQ